MAAYYNEHDKFAAAWLRELIKRDVIAQGEVDERDIQKVTAAELRGFTQCHFFAGIGVWSWALRNAGWPDTKRVWTGSCPCQPFSVSGIRKAASDERHLWPCWFPLIRESSPGVIFGEQVASDDGLAWLDVVSSDLENQDYTIGAVDTCAAGFGAPQISQRLYFVAEAKSNDGRLSVCERGSHETSAESRGRSETGDLAEARDTERRESAIGRSDDYAAQTERKESAGRARECGTAGELAAANITGEHEWTPGGQQSVYQFLHGASELGAPESERLEGYSGNVGDKYESRRDEAKQARSSSDTGATGDVGASTGGRFAVRRRTQGNSGQCAQPGVTNGFWSDAEWIPCRDGKARPVESGTFPLAYGAAARVGRLRGYGNALVAPQAIEFIKAYMSLTEHGSQVTDHGI